MIVTTKKKNTRRPATKKKTAAPAAADRLQVNFRLDNDAQLAAYKAAAARANVPLGFWMRQVLNHAAGLPTFSVASPAPAPEGTP